MTIGVAFAVACALSAMMSLTAFKGLREPTLVLACLNALLFLYFHFLISKTVYFVIRGDTIVFGGLLHSKKAAINEVGNLERKFGLFHRFSYGDKKYYVMTSLTI